MQTTVIGRLDGRLGRRLLLPCLLVLALLLAHELLMATERHAMDMSVARERGMPVALVAHVAAVSALPEAGEAADDRSPLSGWEECLAQSAILPTLLLLLALVGIWRRLSGGPPISGGPRTRGYGHRFLHPPPLTPTRRQALLQVFRN